MEYFIFFLAFVFGFMAVINYSSYSRGRNIYYFKISFLNRELTKIGDKSKYILTKKFDPRQIYDQIGEPEIKEENFNNPFYKSVVEDFEDKKRIFKLLNFSLITAIFILLIYLLIEYPLFLKQIIEND